MTDHFSAYSGKALKARKAFKLISYLRKKLKKEKN
jgi:hypothetical protein